MKKIMISILCLAMASMACLSTAANSSLDVSGEVNTAPIEASMSATAEERTQTISPTLVTVQRCAVVIADEALHLRGAASESAFVLTWLTRGDVVQVVSNSDPNWSEVLFGKYQGFARSIYLKESECEK